MINHVSACVEYHINILNMKVTRMEKTDQINENIDNNNLFNDTLIKYNRDNPKKGYLRFQITTSNGDLPLKDAVIYVYKLIGNDYFISKVLYSDESGRTNDLPLPAPSKQLSQKPGEGVPYSLYNVRISEPSHRTVDVNFIPIFEGIITIQSVRMKLAFNNEDKINIEIINGFNPYDL